MGQTRREFMKELPGLGVVAALAGGANLYGKPEIPICISRPRPALGWRSPPILFGPTSKCPETAKEIRANPE